MHNLYAAINVNNLTLVSTFLSACIVLTRVRILQNLKVLFNAKYWMWFAKYDVRQIVRYRC